MRVWEATVREVHWAPAGMTRSVCDSQYGEFVHDAREASVRANCAGVCRHWAADAVDKWDAEASEK